jgi:hypothetical protein
MWLGRYEWETRLSLLLWAEDSEKFRFDILTEPYKDLLGFKLQTVFSC